MSTSASRLLDHFEAVRFARFPIEALPWDKVGLLPFKQWLSLSVRFFLQQGQKFVWFVGFEQNVGL